jgi:hypothetical protein
MRCDYPRKKGTPTNSLTAIVPRAKVSSALWLMKYDPLITLGGAQPAQGAVLFTSRKKS